MSEARQPIGFALRDAWPWPAFAGLARLGEAIDYEAVFLPEIAGRDAFAALTGLAGETTRLLLGTGVVPMGSRAVRLAAMGVATVQERSGGRAILGIGTGGSAPGALAELRRHVEELRALVGGAGPSGAAPLTLSIPRAVPLWIAALGPRALRMAGEVADGVLLNWCPPERVAQARELVEQGARDADRDPSAITVAVYVRACLIEDQSAALSACAAAAAEYASYPAYARQLAAVGLGDEAEAAAAAHRSGRPQDTPERLVRELCLVGEPSFARGRLESYRQAGADLPVVYPVAAGADPAGGVRETLEHLAPRQ